MRKALIVGIDHYNDLEPLDGCVTGAHALDAILARHGDGTVNFDTELLTGTGPGGLVTQQVLRKKTTALLSDDADIALFYFAGRGHVSPAGGHLVTSEATAGDGGLPLDFVLKLANTSRARNKVIILDCSHSGSAGNLDAGDRALGLLAEGLTIMTAAAAGQYAAQGDSTGVFTELLVDALHGTAANLVGDITPGSIYAHVDQSLGAWAQRPLFKTNVKRFVSLRTVEPTVDLADLRRITEFFPERGYFYELDPSYEPERHREQIDALPPPDPEKTQIFAILQKFNRVNLLIPDGAPHMWHAAIESKRCKLTALGEHYRKLVANGRL